MDQGLESRFWTKVQKSDGCWIWTGAKNTQGYGNFKFDGHVGKAHRYSYQLHRGAIPEGSTLDHLCRVRACVNPNHLEAVSLAINCSRRPARVVCLRGHELTPENTAIYGGKRICRQCVRITQARRRGARVLPLVQLDLPLGSEPCEVPISTRAGGLEFRTVAS